MLPDNDDSETPEEGEEGQPDESLNTADAKSIERASRRAKVWIAQRRQFWCQVMSTEIGRRAIWEFLTLECNFNNLPAAISPSGVPDPMASMAWMAVYHLGRRFYDMLERCDHNAVYAMRVENDAAFAEATPKRRAS